MSRGLGRLQRGLWETIQQHGKPMTFEEMRAVIRQVFEMEDGAKLHPPFERSLRRALHRMVDNGGLIAIGSGGRADPYRYFMHPMVIAMAMPEETETLMERLAADPGANEALNKCLAKDMAGIEAAQKA